MKKSIRGSVIRTSIGFLVIILYCILSLIQRFNYVDLVYLVVVVIFFAVFLKYVSELWNIPVGIFFLKEVMRW